MICTFYYKMLVLYYLQNSRANTVSLLSCFFDVLALTKIALINVSCIFCQHLSLLFIAKFSINSCLHFLIQERGPRSCMRSTWREPGSSWTALTIAMMSTASPTVGHLQTPRYMFYLHSLCSIMFHMQIVLYMSL
jgi:hypothetical protein